MVDVSQKKKKSKCMKCYILILMKCPFLIGGQQKGTVDLDFHPSVIFFNVN